MTKKPNKKPLLVNERKVFSCAIKIYFNIQTIAKGVLKKINAKEAQMHFLGTWELFTKFSWSLRVSCAKREWSVNQGLNGPNRNLFDAG